MDIASVADAAKGEGLALGVVVAVFLAGLRHGFDIDHIAAISDITSAQPDRKRSLFFATAYALGHMLVVFALGLVAVFAGEAIPDAADSIAARFIGLTLVALGVYVVVSLIRFRRDFRMRSRWMLLVAGARRVLRWIRPHDHVVVEHEHEHDAAGHHHDVHDSAPAGSATRVATKIEAHAHTHRHIVPMPSDPFTEYGVRTSLLVGMIHGIGAETPTQVLLFSTAAGVAGAMGGVVLVAAFVVGLLLGNSVLALVTTAGFAAGKKVPVIYMTVAAATAIVSVYVGTAYVLHRPEILPGFLGG